MLRRLISRSSLLLKTQKCWNFGLEPGAFYVLSVLIKPKQLIIVCLFLYIFVMFLLEYLLFPNLIGYCKCLQQTYRQDPKRCQGVFPKDCLPLANIWICFLWSQGGIACYKEFVQKYLYSIFINYFRFRFAWHACVHGFSKYCFSKYCFSKHCFSCTSKKLFRATLRKHKGNINWTTSHTTESKTKKLFPIPSLVHAVVF